jgi:hypothetical protein
MKSLIMLFVALAIVFAIQAFRKKKGNRSSLLDIGKLLFSNDKEGFDSFYNLYLSDKAKFLSENDEFLQEYDHFDLQKLKPIEVLYLFGNAKELLCMTDWRGEENEQEIETFIDHLLTQKHTWTNTSNLRVGTDEDKQRDGKFIIDLLKSIDKDLQTINQRLVFFDLGWDAYVYTTVDSNTFREVISTSPNEFHGVEKLKK